eukprot:765378-Hanusia_phi.AAC.2
MSSPCGTSWGTKCLAMQPSGQPFGMRGGGGGGRRHGGETERERAGGMTELLEKGKCEERRGLLWEGGKTRVGREEEEEEEEENCRKVDWRRLQQGQRGGEDTENSHSSLSAATLSGGATTATLPTLPAQRSSLPCLRLLPDTSLSAPPISSV